MLRVTEASPLEFSARPLSSFAVTVTVCVVPASEASSEPTTNLPSFTEAQSTDTSKLTSPEAFEVVNVISGLSAEDIVNEVLDTSTESGPYT